MITQRAFDVIVVGGGLSGVCAAIGAARAGAKTALIHDRPLLGGNASGELRIHIAGADCSGQAIARSLRESGAIDEIRIEHLRRNPADSHDVLSLICRERVETETNIEIFMNTRVRAVRMGIQNRIRSVEADQLTTEKQFILKAKTFIDCTGDGFVATQAGATFRIGREGQNEFNESLAPQSPDTKTLPSCVQFHLKDMGKPTPFTPPHWAYCYRTDDDLPFRDTDRSSWQFGNLCGGFWWLSAGGDRSTIDDNEEIYRQLLCVLMGVWDHMKNHGDHGAENFALNWITPLPGKRESRRIEGRYWLNQNDIMEGKIFDDRVAYGGWPVDVHVPEGVFSKEPPNISIPLARPYTIPLRCLISKDIPNLLFAGRDASFTHVALGSARVMATCGLTGQAAGVASAVGIDPQKVQQELLRQGVYIPYCRNEDPRDLARQAVVSASSESSLIVPESPQNACPFRHRLFQLFPLSENRLDFIEILIESPKPSPLRAGLRKAKDLWDFSSTEDLARCETATVGNGREWITLRFNRQSLDPGLYWVWVEADPETTWLGHSAAPIGTVRGRYEPRDCDRPELAPPYQTMRGTFIFRLTPESKPYSPANVLNGVTRPEQWTNAWVSQPLSAHTQWLELTWSEPVQIRQLQITFDGQFDSNITWPAPLGVFGCGVLPAIARHYDIQVKSHIAWYTIISEENNYQYFRVHRFNPVSTSGVRILVHGTNGSPEARIFEIRAY